MEASQQFNRKAVDDLRGLLLRSSEISERTADPKYPLPLKVDENEGSCQDDSQQYVKDLEESTAILERKIQDLAEVQQAGLTTPSRLGTMEVNCAQVKSKVEDLNSR